MTFEKWWERVEKPWYGDGHDLEEVFRECWDARNPELESMRKMVRKAIDIRNKRILTRLEWIFLGFFGGFAVSQVIYSYLY